MNCEQARTLINPYLDGELDAARILEMEQHLQACSACALAQHNLQGLKKALKQDALFFAAPKDFSQQIKAELHCQLGDQPRRKFWDWNWLSLTTSTAALACLALLLTITLTRPSEQQQFAQALVSNHIRSLMANHALDVVSSDQHTVKPWFNGKVDFSPPVKDLAAQGFPLIGGRLEYIGNHTVAALIFQRNKHLINLFVWPAKDSDSPPTPLAPIQGFHLVHWTQTGMQIWAVSDLNEKELAEFAELYDAEHAQIP